MDTVLEISCDEAGHTGPQLLNRDQRYFGYASVAVPDDEAWSLIDDARKKHTVQMPELKAPKLMKTGRGQALIAHLIEKIDGRYAVNVHDKLLALCGWAFEYIYEPVYQDDPGLLYNKNLHRFVAMYVYLFFSETGGDAEGAIQQFQKYMRSLNEEDAPILFKRLDEKPSNAEPEHPFELILRFARGYRDIILADNARLRKQTLDDGKWVLDLSISSLWSHLNHWGRQDRPVRVQCDQSKPLEAMFHAFTGDERDAGINRARKVMGYEGPLGWRLAEPVAFVDSRAHPAVQLADVVVGTAVWLFSNECPVGFQPTAEKVQKHMLRDSVLPDFEVLDLKQRQPAVNWLILYDLALRAERGADPYENLEEMYLAAEVSWVQGEFKPPGG